MINKAAFLFLISVFCLCGCYSEEADLKKNGLWIGYVPGPFFHYGQAELAQSRHVELGRIESGPVK